MKKLLIILVLATSILSCKKSKTAEYKVTFDIIGTPVLYEPANSYYDQINVSSSSGFEEVKMQYSEVSYEANFTGPKYNIKINCGSSGMNNMRVAIYRDGELLKESTNTSQSFINYVNDGE